MTPIIDLRSGLDVQDNELAKAIDQDNDFATLIIEASLSAIITYDLEFKYTLFNPAAEEVTGVSKEDAIGKNMFEVFPFMKGTFREETIRRAINGEASRTDYAFPNRLTGEMKFVESQHSPITNEFGKIIGGLVILHDVTKYQAQLRELAELKNRR